MRESQSGKLHEPAFHYGPFPAVAANGMVYSCGRPLALVLTLLASVLGVMAAQTGATPAAAIHDHLRKAAEDLKANDPNAAVKEFNAVLALDPKNVEAYANLGVVAYFRRDYQNASQYLRKALAIDPSLAKTQALLGICQKRLGDPSAGALLQGSFLTLKDKSLRRQVGMELAVLYEQQREPERAVPVMQKLVSLYPDDVEILYLAQRLYQELAEDTLNKLAVLAPGSARMQQVIAEGLINAGDLSGATEHYRKALQIDPRVPGVHFELAQAMVESAPSDPAVRAEAEKELAAAVATDGDSAKVQCEFGRIALLESDLDRAHEHYADAFRMAPGDTEAQLGLGRVLMTMEKPREAKRYLEMAVQADPLNAEAHYRLAQVCKRLLMTSEAEKEMKLFQEIKKTKDQVRTLYRQMNRQPSVPADEKQESDQ
jgi:tetratricopeptide (TPR) repeat protein